MYELTKLNDLIPTLSLSEADQVRLLSAVGAVAARVAADEAERQKDSAQEYWDTVSVIAKEAFEEHGDDTGAAGDFIHESVDGNYWVIYYHANYKVMQYTDNDSAFEEYGDLPSDWGKALTLVAFCAMYADTLAKYNELVEAFENREEDEDDNTNTEED